MSHREKEILVVAYLAGNGSGTDAVCTDIDENEVVLKFREDVPPGDRTCSHFARAYTHANQDAFNSLHYADPYVSVLDGFYEHQECRMMPYFTVLRHLNDAEYMSSEQLYRFVRSGSAAWGFFSGFDGIEKCYGVDRKR